MLRLGETLSLAGTTGFVLAGALATSAPALAGGFAINEQSASAAGTATAGAGAAAEDAGTIFYNPAGMTRLHDHQLLLAGQGFLLDSDFENGGTIDGTGDLILGSGGIDNRVVPLPALFGMVSVSDRVRLGLGITSPFGLVSDYDDDWVGHYNTLLSSISTVDINPSVAVRVTDWLSVGAGVSAQYASGERRNDLDFGTICFTEFLGAACAGLGIVPQGADGRLQFEGDDWGFGYNFGVLIEPRAQTRIGIAYRSPIHHSLAGDADFSVPAVAAPLTLGGTLFRDTDATAEITLPSSLSISLYHDISPRLALLGEVTWTGWHSFETLRIQFDNPTQPDTVEEEDWRDSFRYSLGLRYRPTDELVLRAGLAYDETPVQDALRNPSVPGNDRLVLAAGVGYRLSDAVALDFAYVYARERDAEVEAFRPESGTVVGQYHNRVHIVSAQLGWRF